MRWVLRLCVLGLSACSQPGGSVMPVEAPVKVDRQMSLQELQQACLDYEAPATQVMYTEEPAFVAAHTQGEGGYRFIRLGSETPRHYRVDTVHLPVDAWERLSERAGSRGLHGMSKTAAEVRPLLHGMKTADGRQWLVTMILFPYSRPVLDFSATIFAPLEGEKPEQPRVMGQSIQVPIAYVPPLEGKALRLYGAQFDEKDFTRFTMAYEVNGERGVIRGELKAEPNPQLTLVVADGPLKPQ